jgi:hypothetical protein
MTSTTPIRDLTAAARSGLKGSRGKSIGLILVYMLLLAGSANIPLAGGMLQLIFAAPLVAGLHTFFSTTIWQPTESRSDNQRLLPKVLRLRSAVAFYFEARTAAKKRSS